MREIDPVKNSMGYVPTKVIEIWRANKNLKSLYDAIREYCNLRSKDFNMIAVHIAEYRAMNKLIGKIRLSSSKKDSPKKSLEMGIKEATKKKRAKENKITRAKERL